MSILESEGYRYLLNILCQTMRHLEVIPMVSLTTVDCSNTFILGWVKNLGLSGEAVSMDNSPCFISQTWKDTRQHIVDNTTQP